MGFVLQQVAGAGAPDVDDGMTDARFDGLVLESHDDWATPRDKFGRPDDGKRLRFNFTLLTDAGEVRYDDGGDPVEVNRLTKPSMHKKSTAYGLMKGLLTPKELALIDAGQAIDSESVEGRRCQLLIAHNDSDWPTIEAVMPSRKNRS